MVLKRHSSFILLVLKNCTFGFADYTAYKNPPFRVSFSLYFLQYVLVLQELHV